MSLLRALKREAVSLYERTAWLLEDVATKADVERLREEIRELRRPQ